MERTRESVTSTKSKMCSNERERGVLKGLGGVQNEQRFMPRISAAWRLNSVLSGLTFLFYFLQFSFSSLSLLFHIRFRLCFPSVFHSPRVDPFPRRTSSSFLFFLSSLYFRFLRFPVFTPHFILLLSFLRLGYFMIFRFLSVFLFASVSLRLSTCLSVCIRISARIGMSGLSAFVCQSFCIRICLSGCL